MRIEQELARFTPERGTILAIGVFDGVHRGHQHLLGYLKRQALVRDLLSGAVTFRPHPQRVLSPEAPLPCLTSPEEKVRLLKGLGIDLVVFLSFTPELAQLTAAEFIALLQKYLKLQGLVVGPDFVLGRGREGNVLTLHSLGKEMGFTVEVVPPLLFEGEVVSSTAIRRSLAAGDMKRVRQLLGRPFSLSGVVIRGAERGRSLGFPTANLAVNSEQALPADGVYATKAYFADRYHPSVSNIGVRPTFGSGERMIEVFLLDFSGDLYGQELRIELVERLREERRFPSAEELRRQMEKDAEQARMVLEAEN